MSFLNEVIYVWFKDKKYSVPRVRYSELIQKTVLSAMPCNYDINFIQMSLSTESQYFTVLNQNKLYSFRISSHETSKASNAKSFITNDYQDFKDLRLSIKRFLESDNYITIKIQHLLLLMFLQKAADEKIKVRFQAQQLILDDKVYSLSKGGINGTVEGLINFGLVYYDTERKSLKNSGSGRALLNKNVNEEFNDIRHLTLTLMDYVSLAADFSKRNELNKELRNRRIENDYPENAVEASLGNNSYVWFIPKRFRGKINLNDRVKVMTTRGSKVVIVKKLLEVDDETKKLMNPVIKILTED